MHACMQHTYTHTYIIFADVCMYASRMLVHFRVTRRWCYTIPSDLYYCWTSSMHLTVRGVTVGRRED